MTAKIPKSFLLLPLFAGIMACGQGPTRPPSLGGQTNKPQGADDANGGKTGDKGGDDAVKPNDSTQKALAFELNDPAQDASDYTFGVAEWKSSDFANETIKLTRYFKTSNPSALNDEQKTALSDLCRDLGISLAADKLDETNEIPAASQKLYLVWRSHYPLQTKLILDELQLSGQTDIQCVLKVAPGKTEALPFYQIFDPLPTLMQKIKGTSRPKDAVDEGLMLPLALGKISIDEKTLTAVSKDSAPKLGVKALGKEALQLSLNSAATVPSCYQDAAGSTKLVNGSQDLVNAQEFKDAAGIELGQIFPRSTEGRLLKGCAQVKTNPLMTATGIETRLSCDQYLAIKNEGIEAGCQWDLEVRNKLDPENSLPVRFTLPKAPFKVFNIKQVDSALAGIPLSDKNPIRNNTTKFVGFNAKALKSMEQMFDLWIAVEPVSYQADFAAIIRTVNLQNCDSGVVGFASFGSSFTICYLAFLTDEALNRKDEPHRPILQLITAAHEVRHANRWLHDKDRTNYKPCEGTAASGATMHAIVTQCQEPYCLVLKNMAIREYIAELNYSLARDSRKFQGQCKTWNEDMGVTDKLTR